MSQVNLTPEQFQAMAAQLAALTVQNAELQAQLTKSFRLQVSVKGAVSVYGTRRIPITLYADEFETILSKADEIKKFIADNAAKLSRKTATKVETTITA